MSVSPLSEQQALGLGSGELVRRARQGDRCALEELERRCELAGPGSAHALALHEASRRRPTVALLALLALALAAVALAVSPRLLRQGAVLLPEPGLAAPAQVTIRPAPRLEGPTPAWLERGSGPVRRARRAWRRAEDGGAVAGAASRARQETDDEDRPPPKIVVLPGEVSGDDEVITVKPAARMKPLFSPEEFRRRGMRRILGGHEPVRAAPEGIEAEAD